MKRMVAFVLSLFFLTGCSGAPKEIERGLELRASVLQGSACSFDVEITADYGDKVHIFSMNCQGDSQGNLNFTVTAPETISGITGTITEEGGKLTFDDTALQFDLMADDQISPVSAPWVFLKTLRSGYITSACMEEELLRLTIDDSYDEDALTLDIWVNDGNAPVRAEILYDGKRIVSLTVGNFVIS